MGLMRLKRLQRRPRSVWFKDGGNDTFWQNLVNGKHGDETWKKNFRLTKEKFYELVDMLRPYISPDDTSPNHRKLDADKKLAVCLYYLKDTGSMWMTANAFGIHQTTVSQIVFDICDAITRKLGPHFLYMPRTEDEVKQKATYDIILCAVLHHGIGFISSLLINIDYDTEYYYHHSVVHFRVRCVPVYFLEASCNKQLRVSKSIFIFFRFLAPSSIFFLYLTMVFFAYALLAD